MFLMTRNIVKKKKKKKSNIKNNNKLTKKPNQQTDRQMDKQNKTEKQNKKVYIVMQIHFCMWSVDKETFSGKFWLEKTERKRLKQAERGNFYRFCVKKKNIVSFTQPRQLIINEDTSN